MSLSSLINRRLSLMLALRYLNPLRTHFSVITLMCLMGVALGVMVLVVVLSVMGGLQRDIRDRLLSYTPHILINSSDPSGTVHAMQDWQALGERIKSKVAGVQSYYPQIEEFALVDSFGAQRPATFRGIDPQNSKQMQELSTLISEGSFELGFEEQVVISNKLANDFKLKVGDTLRLYSARNFEPMFEVYKQSEYAPLSANEAFKDFSSASATFAKNSDEQNLQQLSLALDTLNKQKMRAAEAALLEPLQEQILQTAAQKPTKQQLGEIAAAAAEAQQQLSAFDAKQSDLDAFNNLKSLVLPKDMQVIGIYQSSQHTTSPEIFMPLTSAQDLLELGSAAHGLALRIDNPYDFEPVVQGLQKELADYPEILGIQPWSARFESWFKLINQERTMMTFVLSFITLISGFCIMAVMLTVTIQRKREISVMLALGATTRQIVCIFLWQGIIIGSLGSLLGVISGLQVIQHRLELQKLLRAINFDPFPMSFHGVSIPALVNNQEVICIAIGAFVMVIIACILPAFNAARQRPAQSLRSL